MPSSRRLKLIVVVAFTALIVVLYNFASSRSAPTGSLKTDSEPLLKDLHENAAAVQQRLKEAEQAAKDKANIKAPDANAIKEKIINVVGGSERQKQMEGANGEFNAMDEIDSILKRSPVIIFSKSYCPHSKRAKSILLDGYKIVPAPFVVELDQHPHMSELQNALQKTTGRRTVPNIMVVGQSIGGADDVHMMNQKGELINKIKGLAGKNIMSIDKLRK